MCSRRVAQVYLSYDHPTQPYLRHLYEKLRERSVVQVQAFSLDSSSGHTIALTGTSRRNKLANVVRHSWRLRRKRYFNALPFRERIEKLGRFSSLLVWEPSVIHFVNSTLYQSLGSWLQDTGVKVVVSFRGYDVNVRPLVDAKWRETLRIVFEKADILHFVSMYLRDQAIQMGAPVQKCRVVYPCTNVASYPAEVRTPESKGNLNIVSTGRLTWEKGFSQALLAIKKVIDRGVNVEYFILGEGSEREHLTHMANALGIGHNLHLCGTKPASIVQKYLKMADIYFHPSESEALSVALLEAAAMGKPIVATEVGGIPEIVEHNVSGLLVPSYDSENMAEALFRLAQDSGLRCSLGNSALNSVNQKFGIEKECREWEEIYTTL